MGYTSTATGLCQYRTERSRSVDQYRAWPSGSVNQYWTLRRRVVGRTSLRPVTACNGVRSSCATWYSKA
eukprot:562398-Rhodomonas_salina.1